MNILNRNLFALICFILLIAGCNNDLSIISATPDKVVITGEPVKFVNAYQMAKRECEKYTKTTKYITDETAELEVVAFSCEAGEVVAEPQVEATEETQEEIEPQTETEEVPSE